MSSKTRTMGRSMGRYYDGQLRVMVGNMRIGKLMRTARMLHSVGRKAFGLGLAVLVAAFGFLALMVLKVVG